MSDRLPPLNALRAFEAAARHLSLARAAAELHVTPAAVSQQIRTLEETLGLRLFQRRPRGLVLTAAARAGLPRLREGFAGLTEGVKRIRQYAERRTLTVWMTPSFAAKWLVPRLHRFAGAHPEIDMRIAASSQLIAGGIDTIGLDADTFRIKGIDVAIAFGTGKHPGCQSRRLLEVSAVPLCSPKLLEGAHPLRRPEDLRHHVLLHDETVYAGRPSWADWLATAGVTGIDADRGRYFNQVALALDAAIEGQGVVLSLRPLAEPDLASGRLVLPFGPALKLEHAYYVVHPEEVDGEVRVAAFRDWLLSEAGARRSGRV
ncbi:MAG: transcriptional regulator GcvA [Candidatus Competibacterales bacterium]|nr:transcriptional regulator GcvA [Candidatus Competibacterales bacterium]